MSQKLELTWIGKEDKILVEPRILIEDKQKSNTVNDEKTENMLIHGDNLLSLKALLSKFENKIKCIYIDPPYNTGKAFNTYDDNIEHSIWLSLMRERLELLKRLMSQDGVIYIQINDDEASYLKVLCDEVFGRNRYETTFYVKVRHEDRILREDNRYQLCIEQVLCYSKSDSFIPPRREKTKNVALDYKWNVSITGNYSEIIKIGAYDVEVYKPESYKICQVNEGEGQFKQYQIRGSLITQSGSASEYYEKYLRERREKDGLGTLYKVIGMGKAGDGLGYRYIIQPEKESSKNGFYFQGNPIKEKKNIGRPYPNFYDMTKPFNNVGYEGVGYFNGGKKPEAWINLLLSLVHFNEGDYVLDSFLGTGTTCAVAHKKGLNWIGIELGDHAYTHCKPRLDEVISGKDKLGITEDVQWKGGGGYRFFELAPSLIMKDDFGEDIINEKYNPDMLASAVALHEGFVYQPDEKCFWKQAKGSDNSYLFTTTRHVTPTFIDSICTSMTDEEYLIIACKSFDKEVQHLYKKITIKKIPQCLLENCEFGRENYKLNIVNPPVYEDEEIDDEY